MTLPSLIFAVPLLLSSVTTVLMPPSDLLPGATVIATTSEASPDGAQSTTTYATETDDARVAVRIVAPDNHLILWGRWTTADSVNNAGLGLVPAWKPPADFNRLAFLEATGCADGRLVSTDTPRADTDTNELGWTASFLLPAADHPITGELSLCLTAGGHIVQVASFGPTGGEPLAPADELTAAVVAWLAAAPEPEEPAEECADTDDGEFRVMVVEDC